MLTLKNSVSSNFPLLFDLIYTTIPFVFKAATETGCKESWPIVNHILLANNWKKILLQREQTVFALDSILHERVI